MSYLSPVAAVVGRVPSRVLPSFRATTHATGVFLIPKNGRAALVDVASSLSNTLYNFSSFPLANASGGHIHVFPSFIPVKPLRLRRDSPAGINQAALSNVNHSTSNIPATSN